MYTLLFLGDSTSHYDLYPILNMMNKYEEQMEQKTNFFSVIPYSNFLRGAKQIKIGAYCYYIKQKLVLLCIHTIHIGNFNMGGS